MKVVVQSMHSFRLDDREVKTVNMKRTWTAMAAMLALAAAIGIDPITAYGAASTHMIFSVASDGTVVTLMGGDAFLVRASSRATVLRWKGGDAVLVDAKSKSCPHVEIIDVSRSIHDTACAKVIKS